MKKLNKRRVKMLAGIIVGVLLLVGTCIGSIINSVDYDETEVYNEINYIKRAASSSNHLREETEAIVNIYDTWGHYDEYSVEEFDERYDELSSMLDVISDMDFDIIKDYCNKHEENNEISYEDLMDLYNATRRRLYYCSYVYECMIIDNEEFDESDIPKMKIMLETCEGYSEVNDNLKVYANMYDEECGFEEYK